jgi:hypothetical protein
MGFDLVFAMDGLGVHVLLLMQHHTGVTITAT